jgi:glycosyltransferase involved in cell wall biosynthesis
MLEGARVVVVVPAFQEERQIERVLASIPTCVDDVCVVDDASRDSTSEIAQSFAPRISLVRHERNRGVGAAIATGYRWALERTAGERDAICVMAGDGQMHPDDLEAVARPIVRGDADYSKGDRFGAPHHARGMPIARKIGGRVFSTLTSLAIDQPIRDSQCGYTAISRRALLGLDLFALWPRFGYPNDLLGHLAERRLRIEEVPVRPVYDGEISKLRPWHLFPISALVVRAAIRVRVRRSKKE